MRESAEAADTGQSLSPHRCAKHRLTGKKQVGLLPEKEHVPDGRLMIHQDGLACPALFSSRAGPDASSHVPASASNALRVMRDVQRADVMCVAEERICRLGWRRPRLGESEELNQRIGAGGSEIA